MATKFSILEAKAWLRRYKIRLMLLFVLIIAAGIYFLSRDGGKAMPMKTTVTEEVKAPPAQPPVVPSPRNPVSASAVQEAKVAEPIKEKEQHASDSKSAITKPVVTPHASSAYLPMARRGEIASPKVLAERIRESLKKDSSGNTRVRGADITPNGFLSAIQKAGGTVDGVGALSVYLESLVEGDMPKGKNTMSRVHYVRDKVGTETYTLDIEKGHSRGARKGERGWFDANTGDFIMAGDCGNSPLAQVKEPEKVVPPPRVVIPSPALVPQVIPDAVQPIVYGCINPTNKEKCK